ncbi:MAG: hypothetical protein D9V44_10335 [Actinobacteria bacterium]|nr:MAG: hypothetical protein D9V44_10335 [Actinomycetota bacterium]
MTLIAAALILAVPAHAFAASTDLRSLSATSILADRAELDGMKVTLHGEAIGELLLTSDDGAWLSVLSDGTALGVHLPRDIAEPVTRFGDYETTGDEVRVTGEFRQACDEHGGDMDIHATSLEVVATGTSRQHPVMMWKAGLAVVAFGVAGAGTRYSRRRRLAVEGE